MKTLVFLLLLLFVNIAVSSPLPRQRLPHDEQDHRFAMIPDNDGKMHLVDLQSYEEAIEPNFVAEEDVRFYLFTRSNPTTAQEIFMNVESIRTSHFNENHWTKFSIHGWLSDSETFTNTLARNAFLANDNFNFIVVDWGIGAGTINYVAARLRVRDTGAFVGRFIDFLHEHGFLQFHQLQLIGISLGGQTVGMAGKNTQRGRVQVIMSLDPAGPLFFFGQPHERVNYDDGEYVEVIHTNGGLLGFLEPIGQADFFPNFGSSQPGCITDITGSCSHARAVILHAESINTRFTGHECAGANGGWDSIRAEQCQPTDRVAFMGGPFGHVGQQGNFYMATSDSAPFSLG